jgi:hypothetical protein
VGSGITRGMRAARAHLLGLTLTLFACTARSGGGGGGFFPSDAGDDDATAASDVPAGADVVTATDVPAGVDVVTAPDVPAGVCTPNEVTCASDSALRVCSADGSSANTVPCGAGTRCNAGQCVANLCAPNSVSCGPEGRRTCNAEGTAYTPTPCPSVANATARCEGNGTCVQVCADGYGDCDGGSGNGCEASLRDNGANCGACGRSCASGTMCMNGACQSSCGALTQCGGSCVDTRSSAAHCGRCDNACVERPNAPPTCRSSVCTLACSGTFADCDFNQTTGCEVDLNTSGENCGLCGRACATGQACVGGFCQSASVPRSCREVLAARPGTPSGPQRIDPDGTGPAAAFEVYCDMTTAGGGWTLAATFTNADIQNWTPRSAYWVNSTAFGTYNSLNNADAKSPAYYSLPADEMLIRRGGVTPLTELQTATSCLRNLTLLQVMSVSSVYSSTCARSCTAITQTGIFAASVTCQGTGVRFRCRDDSTTSVANGYSISSDDNSMITSMTNSSTCTANQSGLGGMSTSTYADVDSDLASSVVATDTAPRHLFVR